jgi:Flp pilus assembly protein TadB
MRNRSFSLNPIPEEFAISFGSLNWPVPILEEGLCDSRCDWLLIGMTVAMVCAIVLALMLNAWIASVAIVMALLIIWRILQCDLEEESLRDDSHRAGSFIMIEIQDDCSAQL